jgi:hypothetical protein
LTLGRKCGGRILRSVGIVFRSPPCAVRISSIAIRFGPSMPGGFSNGMVWSSDQRREVDEDPTLGGKQSLQSLVAVESATSSRATGFAWTLERAKAWPRRRQQQNYQFHNPDERVWELDRCPRRICHPSRGCQRFAFGWDAGCMCDTPKN